MSYMRSKRKHKRRQSATSKPRVTASRASSSSDGRRQRELEKVPVFSSGRSVFFDICDTPEEAHNLTLRSELMNQISEIIVRRKLTQSRAAKLFGVTQPRVSDLTRGKIDLFSLESLIDMLTRAGVAVHLIFEQSAA